MKAVFIALAVCVVAVSAGSEQIVDEINQCLSGYDVNPNLFQFYPVAPTATMEQHGCYLACVYKVEKMSAADGTPDLDIMFDEKEPTEFGKHRKAEAVQTAKDCQDKVGSNLCQFYECFFQLDKRQ